jgi:hypothetical protein
MILRSPAAFRAAVDRERLDRVHLDDATLAEVRAAIDESGLLLVGEPHGVRETSSLLHVLATELGAGTLAFEWSFDELGDLVDELPLDVERLWSLPPEAEAFCGDGRFTAGHVALLERLRPERVILFDRLEPVDRERELAERLLAEWDGRSRTIALVGAGHAAGTMASLLPVRAAAIHYERGRCSWRGDESELELDPPATPITIRLPEATPADVPGR